MKHLFITGEIGAGKSYLLNRLLVELGGTVYGFYTKKEQDENGNSKVYIHSVDEGRSYSARNLIAAFSQDAVKKEIFTEVFDNYGVELLTGIPKSAIVVMDELGFLEDSASKFKAKVFEVLDSDCFVLGVVKKKQTAFLDAVRSHERVSLYELDETRREELYKELSNELANK